VRCQPRDRPSALAPLQRGRLERPRRPAVHARSATTSALARGGGADPARPARAQGRSARDRSRPRAARLDRRQGAPAARLLTPASPAPRPARPLRVGAPGRAPARGYEEACSLLGDRQAHPPRRRATVAMGWLAVPARRDRRGPLPARLLRGPRGRATRAVCRLPAPRGRLVCGAGDRDRACALGPASPTRPARIAVAPSPASSAGTTVDDPTAPSEVGLRSAASHTSVVSTPREPSSGCRRSRRRRSAGRRPRPPARPRRALSRSPCRDRRPPP
jgi:hypothetical protein